MNELVILNIILGVLIIGGGFLFIFLYKRKEDRLKQEIKDLKKEIDQRSRDQHQEIKQALSRTQDSYANLQKELGVVHEIGSHVQDLQKIFQSPKLRGNLGEQMLEDLMREVLPQSKYETQYRFKEGLTVDAIIKTESGLIPIDSKYSLDTFHKMKEAEEDKKSSWQGKFKRGIKKRIRRISEKYIRPGESTVDFSLMYLPSEALYYEIIMNFPELIEYGNKKKVYLCSPNTFNYLLRVILLGLEQAEVEETSFQILQEAKTFRQELDKVDSQLGTLFNHLKNARNILEKVQHTHNNLSLKIKKIIHLKQDDFKEKEN